MGKQAKFPCVYCDARLEPGLPFCSSCEQPTAWATNEQRTAYELRQWRMKRATPAPERMSARVEAIVSGASVWESAREAPVREAPPRPAIVPHPNGVWGGGRSAGARAPQPWPPKPSEAEGNGSRDRLHLAPLAEDDVTPEVVVEVSFQEAITEETAPVASAEPIVETPATELDEFAPDAFDEIDSVTAEEASVEASLADTFDVDDADPEWAIIPEDDVLEPVAVLEPVVPPSGPVVPDVAPAVDPILPHDDQTELVRDLLRRVEELEAKLAHRRRSRFIQWLIDLLVVHDPT